MTTQRKIERYGWTPDLPDHRDVVYDHTRSLRAPSVLPALVDLRPLCPPVVDQGQLGSCTANALAGAAGYLQRIDGKPFEPVSRLFIYFQERWMENDISSDNGAQIRDGVKQMHWHGAPSESLWPYDIARFAEKPALAAFVDALQHKVTAYARITTHANRLMCLASGFPFIFGFTVYESFESAAVAQSGVVNLPQSGESVVGGHAVLAVGYDDRQHRYIVRNSWGTAWGMKGYFTIPYDYVDDPSLSDDHWVLRAEQGF